MPFYTQTNYGIMVDQANNTSFALQDISTGPSVMAVTTSKIIGSVLYVQQAPAMQPLHSVSLAVSAADCGLGVATVAAVFLEVTLTRFLNVACILDAAF
jgi:hypothetical protein